VNRIVVKSKVDSNGVLQLTLPVGSADAGQEVQVTIEPINPASQPRDEWQQRILDTAGKWQGDFERPDQGEYEHRAPLS
jgi:hypothetical protein